MIDEFLAVKAHLHSSFSFVNIFLWSDFFDFRLETINGCLCILAYHDPGCFLYLPPLKRGRDNSFMSEAIQECFHIMQQRNHSLSMSRIENVEASGLNSFSPEGFSFVQKSYEYVYFKEDLIALKGKALKSKRNAFNHFTKNFAVQFLPFSKEMIPECLALYEEWAQNRLDRPEDEIYHHMIRENRIVHEKAMRHYEELGLIGRVVLVQGKIVGYSFGFPLNNQTFCILFEITRLDFSGLSVFLFSKFCEDPQLKDYKFINAMDDFGMKNMEAAKMSFRPSVLLPSYVVTRKLKDY